MVLIHYWVTGHCQILLPRAGSPDPGNSWLIAQNHPKWSVNGKKPMVWGTRFQESLICICVYIYMYMCIYIYTYYIIRNLGKNTLISMDLPQKSGCSHHCSNLQIICPRKITNFSPVSASICQQKTTDPSCCWSKFPHFWSAPGEEGARSKASGAPPAIPPPALPPAPPAPPAPAPPVPAQPTQVGLAGTWPKISAKPLVI